MRRQGRRYFILLCAMTIGCGRLDQRSSTVPPPSSNVPADGGIVGADAMDEPAIVGSPAARAGQADAGFDAKAVRPLVGAVAKDKLRLLLTDLVEEAERDMYPIESGTIVEPLGSTDVSMNRSEVLAVPMHVRFARAANTYCRFAILHRDTGRGELVTDALYEQCKKMEELIKEDLNDDGIIDFVYRVYMPSNRADAIVSEVAVYLSDASHATYCYAPKASGALTISEKGLKTFKATILAEARRLGKTVLDCRTP